MFGRTEKNQTPAAPTEASAGKGRPTPSRKEAEAAARDRARASVDKKAASKVLRDKRTEANRRMREGMKAGEEKFLPARDQGPVKRFVRDWVDARLTFMEFLLPVLLLILVLAQVGNDGVRSAANMLQLASMLLLVTDTLLLRVRLKKALKAKFPDENLKGAMMYAFIRTLQLRFMRLPKPNVKFGDKVV